MERILPDPDHRFYVAVLPDTGVAGWIHFHLHKVVESDLRVEIAGMVVDET